MILVSVSPDNSLDGAMVQEQPETLIDSVYVFCGPAISDVVSSSHCNAMLSLRNAVILKLDGAASGTIEKQ